MAVFEYKALNSRGKKKSGIIDAESSLAAKSRLRQKKLFPTSLNKIESISTKKSKKTATFLTGFHFNLFSKVSSSELSMFTRQMATLLSAGFPLVQAMEILVTQAKSKSLQKILSSIKDSIKEGSSFANALALHPNVFSPIFINMVNAGEEHWQNCCLL